MRFAKAREANPVRPAPATKTRRARTIASAAVFSSRPEILSP